MRKFEPAYKINTNAQILSSENDFRHDVDLRLHVLETSATAFADAANEARDQIVGSFDTEIAPRIAQLIAIVSEFDGNTNALRDIVLALVRDNVEVRGDTLNKLLALIDGKANGNHGHNVEQIAGLLTLLDDKAPVNHGHDLSQIAGASQALDTKLSKGANLSDLTDKMAAKANLGFEWSYTAGSPLPGFVWMSSNGITNKPYPLGDSANTIPFINQFGSIAVKPPANSVTWSFYTTTTGLNNQSGFYQDASNRMFMQLSNADGTLGVRFGSDGVNNYVQGREAFFVRAWVNFNGTGTPAIRASGNVSSIIDNGVGDWTINYTAPMPDANYVVSVCGKFDSTNVDGNVPVAGIRRSSNNPSTGSVRIITLANGAVFDCETVAVSIIR
jgi:hypothetical protein